MKILMWENILNPKGQCIIKIEKYIYLKGLQNTAICDGESIGGLKEGFGTTQNLPCAYESIRKGESRVRRSSH